MSYLKIKGFLNIFLSKYLAHVAMTIDVEFVETVV